MAGIERKTGSKRPRGLKKAAASPFRPAHAISTRDAKNQLSAVIREAGKGAEITITSDGEPAAVLISAKRYAELTRRQGTLVEFFRESPLSNVALEIERSRETGRDVDLS
jgi:prevent-host-death family protein